MSVALLERSFPAVWSASFPEEKSAFISVKSTLTGEENKTFTHWKTQMQSAVLFASLLQKDRLHAYLPFRNFWRNIPRLMEGFYLNDLRGQLKDIPMVITGAGPSLQTAYPYLQQLEQKAVITSVGSSIAALSKELIEPHLGIFLDPNLEELFRLKQNTAFSMPFLYTPRLFPDCFATSSAFAGYIRSSMGQYAYRWLEEYMDLKGACIGEYLSYEALSVTTLALEIADFLGCNPIVLVGVDLAYLQEKRYAEGIVKSADNVPEEEVIETTDTGDGSTLKTKTAWLMEKRAIEDFCRRTKSQVIHASKGLAIRHTKKTSLESLIARNPFPIRGYIDALIHSRKSPCSVAQIVGFQKTVQKSIAICKKHLCVLAKNTSFADQALAEIALEKEPAYRFLFYDTKRVLQTSFPALDTKQVYQKMLDLVEKHQEMMRV